MNDHILSELIAEMIAADETAAAARALVTEYMETNGVKKHAAAGHSVAFVAAGTTTAYADDLKTDAAYIEARRAYDAARAPFAYKKPRAAYIRVSKVG